MIKPYKYEGKTYYLIQLSYTDLAGKRHQPKFRFDKKGNRLSSKYEAKLLEAEYLYELKSKAERDYSSLSFSEFHKEYLRKIEVRYKRSTIMQYDGDLKKWLTSEFQSTKLESIKKRVVHKFIYEDLKRLGATPNTQKRILKTLKAVLQAAVDEGYLPRNPALGLKVSVKPTVKKVLNSNEASSFLDNARQVRHRFYYLWAFALLSGMRSGELYALRWVDIDEVTGNISVNSSWSNKNGYGPTKSNNNRIVPISSDLRNLLLELKNIGPYKETLKGLNGSQDTFDDLVLPRLPEWRYGEQARVTREFCALIGLPEVKFHDLRATFITNLLAQGVSLPKVMAIVGHSKTSTTDEYLRLAGVEIRGATDSLGYSTPKEFKPDQGVLSFR